MTHALVVTVHPRTDSLTAAIADRVGGAYRARGASVDLLDLYAEGLDPALGVADEPDWADSAKRYSEEAHAHMARVAAADDIVVVFPVWWFGLPAMGKGWVDRVWNRGFAYEPSTLAGKRMRWIGLAGGPEAYFAKYGFDAVLDTQLRVGVSEFCGITDSGLHLIYDTLEAARVEAVDAVLQEAGIAA